MARRQKARYEDTPAEYVALRKTLAERSPLPFRYPKPILCTDNAAMIASCGFFRYQLGVRNGWDTDVVPNLRVGIQGP